MSTRCVINFTVGGDIEAKIYRQCDGYPDAVLPDMAQFFSDVKNSVLRGDRRFDDPSYLAAKFVVWQTLQYAETNHPLSVTGVGVVAEDPGDIEYRYFVDCADALKTPTVRHEEA